LILLPQLKRLDKVEFTQEDYDEAKDVIEERKTQARLNEEARLQALQVQNTISEDEEGDDEEGNNEEGNNEEGSNEMVPDEDVSGEDNIDDDEEEEGEDDN
jgi:hypothetical protein